MKLVDFKGAFFVLGTGIGCDVSVLIGVLMVKFAITQMTRKLRIANSACEPWKSARKIKKKEKNNNNSNCIIRIIMVLER